MGTLTSFSGLMTLTSEFPDDGHVSYFFQYIFQMVLPHQCLSYIRASQSAHAPTVRAAIQHFNRCACWRGSRFRTGHSLLAMTGRPACEFVSPYRVSLITIATTLRAGESPAERGRFIGRWIEMAQQCRLVKNFSSLKAILSGLQSSAVYRLRRSWETVPK